MYTYGGSKDYSFKLPNGLSTEQPKQCGRLSIKKGKNTKWLGKKGKCYLWGFANFQFMYNKNQQLFIAIEPTSDKDDPITLMKFNKKGKLVGITEKNYYSSFKLKLPNYIHFEEYEPTYDLF
ncbi:hypothetical protein [Viridibacillus arvi]|uniref:hypothetical protein n=1 Tax=Viridibacillus arvi TaxID=263475 RepID=UPI0036E58B19